MKYVLSYSGGADSTAALFWCHQNKIKLDEIIYMEDFFPYPGNYMQKYFDYIQEKFNIKITQLPCDRKYWLEKNKQMPRLPHPWCCRVKSEIFANYCKEKYGKSGIVIILGIRKAESIKRAKYKKKDKWYWNKRFGVNYYTWYPIFNFIDAKYYLEVNGIEINPLYEIHGKKSLGCYKCYKVGDLRWKPIDEQQKFLTQYL